MKNSKIIGTNEVYTVKTVFGECIYRPVYSGVENENGGFDIIDFE